MILLYLTVDGRAIVEKTRINQRLFEMPDGYHPLTNDSVWQDSKRQIDPIVVVIQGVTPPYGAQMARNDILSMLYEIDVAEHSLGKQNVSKIWWRALVRLGEWLWKKGIYLLIAGYIIYNVAVGTWG